MYLSQNVEDYFPEDELLDFMLKFENFSLESPDLSKLIFFFKLKASLSKEINDTLGTFKECPNLLVLDEILSSLPDSELKDYSRIPRNCLFHHQIDFPSESTKFDFYSRQISQFDVSSLIADSSNDPKKFKLFIICFMEKDECKSDVPYIPVVGLVPITYYDQNYLENQPDYSKVQILDR